jgi:acetyltransferase-like isoleucine patch superfamily enzyme
MMKCAPIALFVYNRPVHTLQTLEALMINELADQSVLYIYSDGPKNDATPDQRAAIEEVRKLIRTKKWCGEVHIVEAPKNKGLADSIVDGVTSLVETYQKVIVLEDDIVCSAGFLRYMNDALAKYEKEETVMHITGYMYPHQSTSLPETFLYPLPYPGGGWATWARAWKYYDGDALALYDYFEKENKWKEFNTAGGKYFQEQLTQNIEGKLKTWFVKWHASVMKKHGLTLFPRHSLIFNSGFDSSGEHCGVSSVFDGKIVDRISVDKNASFSKEGKQIILDFYKQLLPSENRVSIKQKIKKAIFNMVPFKSLFKKIGKKIVIASVPETAMLQDKKNDWGQLQSFEKDVQKGNHIVVNLPYKLDKVTLGDYTYVAVNSNISHTKIGKFCSVGPNFLCGSGIHPITGISTAPMFYSTLKQNGMTLSVKDKIEERKLITIGNDVFIGGNVTILDGVQIGHGAVIGAGAVVSKDIPPYAVAVGSPIRIIKYRFTEEQINQLLKIKWWDFDSNKLKEVETYFNDIDKFIELNGID